MKKSHIVSLLSVLFVTATPAVAQFKQVSKQLKNFNRLEQSVQRAAMVRLSGKMIIKAWVPENFVSGQEIGLTGALYPSKITPANVSFAYKVQNTPQLSALEVGSSFLMGSQGMPPAGKAFYEDQTELAQDLNRFYQGQGVARLEGSRTVKLYSLPVDGILYKPAGYNDPLVLDSNEYFVVYDMDGNTGKLVENTPGNLAFYSRPGDPRAFEDVVDFDGQTYHIAQGEPEYPLPAAQYTAPQLEEEIKRLSRENGMDLDHPDFFTVQPSPAVQRDMRATHIQMATAGLPKPVTPVAQLLEENRTRVAAMREQDGYEDVWHAMDGSKSYMSQKSLGRDLSDFYDTDAPQLFNKDTRQAGYVYEIPVNGITYMSPGTMPFTLDPVNQVFFYAKDGSGRLYDRSVLEDPERFEPVTPDPAAKTQREFYERKQDVFKQTRQKDRVGEIWVARYTKLVTSQDQLGQMLDKFHQRMAPRVTNNFTRQECYIYEIPVNGLTYAPEGDTPYVPDPEKYVVLFHEKSGRGQLIERATLNDPMLFTFDK